MRTALVIVDMQEGSFTPRSVRHDAVGLIERLNQLSNRIRAAGGLVVFVQHDGPLGDAHHPGAWGWPILSELGQSANDFVVRKTTCDSFLDTELSQRLVERSVSRLIITGCATDFCVDTTVRSALARRYETIVPEDGHTTSDRDHLAAEKIIAHHNAVWADYIGPRGAATVLPCDAVRVP
ncbi:MAG: isochorismatase family protein [Hyphomicrobiaceae bacterium]